MCSLLNKWAAGAAAVVVGLALVGSAAAETRCYPGESFEKTDGASWVARRNGNVSGRFVEVSRTADCVELYDASRGMVVRLYKAGASYLRYSPSATPVMLGD